MISKNKITLAILTPVLLYGAYSQAGTIVKAGKLLGDVVQNIAGDYKFFGSYDGFMVDIGKGFSESVSAWSDNILSIKQNAFNKFLVIPKGTAETATQNKVGEITKGILDEPSVEYATTLMRVSSLFLNRI